MSALHKVAREGKGLGPGTIFKQREAGVRGNHRGCYKVWAEKVESAGNLAVRGVRMSKRSFGGTDVALCNALRDAQYCEGGVLASGYLERRDQRGSFKTVWVFFPGLILIMAETELTKSLCC